MIHREFPNNDAVRAHVILIKKAPRLPGSPPESIDGFPIKRRTIRPYGYKISPLPSRDPEEISEFDLEATGCTFCRLPPSSNEIGDLLRLPWRNGQAQTRSFLLRSICPS